MSVLENGPVVVMGIAMLLGPVPAMAGPFETIFSGGTGCYRRVYDRAHLKAHPLQRTIEIEIGYRPQPADRRGTESGLVQIYLFSRYRGDAKPLAGGHEAYCRPDGRTTSCSVDGDAGGFFLTPLGRRSVRLEIKDRLTIETDTDFVDMQASDDRTFVLYRQPVSACTGIR